MTTNRVQTIRSNTAGVRPATNSNLPGVLYSNWPDRQIGILDSGKNPIDLLAVRVFSTTASYAVGSYVTQGGFLYRANASVSPGGFNSTQWDKVQTSVDISGAFLPISGGTLTGPLGVYTSPPAGTTNAIVTTAAATTGILAFNAYSTPGGTGWKALGAGRAAFIGYDTSGGVFNFFTTASAALNASVTPVVVATLDASGNLTATGDVTANGNLIAHGATYPAYSSATDFVLSVSGVTRLLQWAGNWYDGWNSTNGLRNWTGFDGTTVFNNMALDGAGHLTVRGAINAGGVIVSPSTVAGAQVSATGAVTGQDITASRNLNCVTFGASGNASISGALGIGGAANVGGNFGVTGNAQVNGSETVLGNLTVDGALTIGSFTTTTLTADTIYYNHLISDTFYGGDYGFGWNGSGTKHRVNGTDEGYLVRSEDIYEMQFTGSAVVGLYDGGAFYWPAYAALTREEAEAKAAAHEATIEDLKRQVEALTRRLAAMEARLA